MPDLETEERAIAASLGDQDALGALYETYADPLLRYMLTRVNNDLLLAEDLSATTWERVARSIRSYETKGNGFPAWLLTIGKHAANEHHRSPFRTKETLRGEMFTLDCPDPAGSPEEEVERRMAAFHLAAAVRSLSPAQRRCVILRFYVGLSLADTAAAMGKKVNAVKQLQHRALTTLAVRVGVTQATVAAQVETFAAEASPADFTRSGEGSSYDRQDDSLKGAV